LSSGRQSANSDLDICVLGEVSMLDVLKALTSVKESLRREINPVVMTTKKFSDLSKKGDRFVARVLSEPKLLPRQITGAVSVKERPTRFGGCS
jgi:hypothetical protein